MPHRYSVRVLGPLPFVLLSLACGDAETPAEQSADAETPAEQSADAEAPAERSAPAAYNGSCSTARWADTSDECWACLCGACTDALNACTEACTLGFQCAMDTETLVNVAADVPCEVRGVVKECMSKPAIQPGAAAILAFDACLIGAGASQAKGEFRACEKVCNVPYPGDVCTRYPEPPPAPAP